MQTIVPHLWFGSDAREAADFYVAAFGKNSTIIHSTVIRGTPSGDCPFVLFSLRGFEFMGISGMSASMMNPSISFMLNFDPSVYAHAREDLNALWAKLSEGGKPMMPLDTYPFSDRYGWIQDKYGVSWQLILTKAEGEPRPFVIPSLMFTGDNTGKAEEAIDFYTSVFKNTKRGITAPYPSGAAPEKRAKIMFADFMLEGQWFAAMDSGHLHSFGFNEGISLLVRSKDQQEIDDLSDKLSARPDAEMCGWLKDRYGLSWQISFAGVDDMLTGDPSVTDRYMKEFLSMKRLDIARLRRACGDGKNILA